MTAEPGPGRPNSSHRARRALIGAAASLGLFLLARLAATFFFPIDVSPLANQLVFLGTPFLLLSWMLPGLSSAGLAGATGINALVWVVLGALIGLRFRRPLVALAAWLLAAGGLAAIAFAGLVLGMMSSSP